MSKAKLAAVRELVAQKKYTEARLILKTIDDPYAREWEARLAVIDPNKPPDEKTTRLSDTNKLIAYVGGMIVVILLANMLGIFLPKPKVDTRPLATASAVKHVKEATLIAIHATELAKPTATPLPPEPLTLMPPGDYHVNGPVTVRTCASKECSAINTSKGEKIEVLGIRERYCPYQCEKWYKIKPLAGYPYPNQYISSQDFEQYLRSGPEPTATPRPTPVFTPQSPIDYYARSGYSTYVCPSHSARCYEDKNAPQLHRHDRIVVVGIIYPQDRSQHARIWYVIQISGDDRLYYMPADDIAFNFSQTAPTATSRP